MNRLFQLIKDNLIPYKPDIVSIELKSGPFLKRDMRHSLVDISRASYLLGYEPKHDVKKCMKEAIKWYGASLD